MVDFLEAIITFITDFLAALSAFIGDKSTFDELADAFGNALENAKPAE